MNWLWRLLNRSQMDARLEKEMRFHIEQHTHDLIERGYTPAEAHRQALIGLGGAEWVKEECREARGTRWLEDLIQDVGFALRALWQKPGFAIVALLTLALGTGATTLVFTLINGVLLKPLPYANADRLLVLQEKTDYSTRLGDLWAFAYPNYADCKREVSGLDLMGFLYNGGTVSTAKNAEFVDAYDVSADVFPLLGVRMARGRAFLPEEDRAGAPPVAILGYGVWQRLFGGDENAVGKSVNFDQKSYTIVGIAPPGFALEGGLELEGETGLFTPLGQDTAPFLARRDRHGVVVWAKLHPGTSLNDARTQLSVIGTRLARQYPDSNKERTFIADPLRPEVGDSLPGFANNTRSTLWLLFGAVTLVLLIACVNVASLLLARAVSRERELAIRVALGASRARVVRQSLTESAVLGLLGGGLGVFLAFFALGPFITFWPGGLPRAGEAHLDWHVMLFGFGVSLLSGILFGLAPALRVPVRNLEQALRAGARTLAGTSRRMHSSYVVSELALAVVLLVSAGMLARTLLRLSALDPGIDIHTVFTGRMALAPSTLKDPAATRAAWDKVLASAREVPGVEAATLVDTVPMREGSNPIGYSTKSGISPSDPSQPTVLANSVTPDYLKVMRIPLREGRFFTEQDRLNSARVAVIDDVMARKAFPGEDPLGKPIWLDPPLDHDPWTVVGVVGHVRYWGLASDDQAQIRTQLYYPFGQVPDQWVRRWSELMSIAVRTKVEPLSVLPVLRQAVRGATGDQVIYQVRTMEQLASRSIARQRFLFALFGLFAAIALLLACTGIYGVLAYLTNQRVPEIGIRIALGANPNRVVRLVMRQSLRMIVAGVVLGALGAAAATTVLERLVEGVQKTDPASFVLMIGVLVAAALAASFAPARRASRIDPLKALRQE
ncbi:MAG TPA: ABC transporter permease [Terriglobales bacterium]|nr:ABC transporter permease [Terriglobales bacterium]